MTEFQAAVTVTQFSAVVKLPYKVTFAQRRSLYSTDKTTKESAVTLHINTKDILILKSKSVIYIQGVSRL